MITSTIATCTFGRFVLSAGRWKMGEGEVGVLRIEIPGKATASSFRSIFKDPQAGVKKTKKFCFSFYLCQFCRQKSTFSSSLSDRGNVEE